MLPDTTLAAARPGTLRLRLLQLGARIVLIQAQLEHASLATTSRYLAHIAPAQLIAAMRARTRSP